MSPLNPLESRDHVDLWRGNTPTTTMDHTGTWQGYPLIALYRPGRMLPGTDLLPTLTIP